MICRTSVLAKIAIILFFLNHIEFFQCHGIYNEPKYNCPKKSHVMYPCQCINGSDNGLFVFCENVNLATLGVALENLAALDTVVDHLQIFKGNIARFYGPLFARVKVRVLTIDKTAIEVMEEYSLYGINKTLQELHIINSNISIFPHQAFGILGKLTYLNIDGHAMQTLGKNIFLNTDISNHLEILRIVNGKLHEIPIESFQPLRKLKTLDLHGNKLENLKRYQFKNLRDVEVLDISFNLIKKLDSQHIADLTKLGWCNVSNNALTELSRGTFARNSVLKVLNLSHNQIKQIDGNSLRGMRFLRRLYLNDNNITEVGRGTFGSVTRIGTIDLARNSLQKIEFQMFSQLNYVEVLDIAENKITEIEKHSFKDIYQAKINISYNAIEKIEALAFENCVNITVLDLSFNRLTDFVKNTFDDTTFATELQVSHNLLTDLSQIPLNNMSGLKTLNASHNNITKIPKNTFPKLYELHTIDLSHNNVTFIANGVFQSLFSLRNMNLSYNNLEEIKSSVFGTLPTLLEMDLSHNSLVSIARGSLAKLTSMRFLNLSHNLLEKLFQIPLSLNQLDLSDNRLKSIPGNTWPIMNSLLYLDLSENQLTNSLEGGSFTGLIVLQKLLLNRNGITAPPIQCLAGMSTLQYLHLEQNNITMLTKSAFGKLPVLFELNLYNNEIRDIRNSAFDGLLQLLTLNLSKNLLENLPTEAFKGLPSLRALDLSHNFLTKIDNKTNGVLDNLLSLETLDLSYNRISFVTKKTFPSNRYIPYNLRNLDLSHNLMPVLTYDITFGTKKLQTLNLSYNHINDIRKGVLGNLTSLQHLDLSHNNLKNLMSEENIFDLPTNLTEIKLNHNQISSIPYKNFLKEPKLQIVDLRGNQLEHFPLSLVWNLQNGTSILFEDNPLYCNCVTRPLNHFLQTKTILRQTFSQVICARPMHLSGTLLQNIDDESLRCTSEENALYTADIYDAQPDIRFRDISINGNNIKVNWYVTSTRDIADFTVFVRNKENAIFYQEEVHYTKRIANIPASVFRNISGDNNNETEICVISRHSSGAVGRWFSAQCLKASDIFQSSKKHFSWKSNSAGSFTVFYMFSFILSIINSAVSLYSSSIINLK